MASTYSTSLRLELMATGDQSGTWGDTTNTNLGTLLEQAIAGVLSVAEGDAELTLTALDGASDQSRNMVVELTGAMTGAQNVIVPTAEKLYLIKNSTTGGYAVTVKTTAGTGVTVPATTARWVYCDGTNVVDGQSGPWTPSTNSGAALGLPTVAWSSLFIESASAGTLATITSTDAGAAAGPILNLYRNSASPAASDVLGQMLFSGEDSAGNTQEYGSIEAVAVDPTSTSEDGRLDFYAPVAGTRTKIVSIGPNLDLAAIGQIAFPATQNASSNVNTLDDYEESDAWTPVLTFGTPGNLNVVYSVQMGSYTKIGRQVTAQFVMTTSTFTHTTASGSLNISGLPFAAKAITNAIFVGKLIWSGITKAGYTEISLSLGATSDVFTVVASGSGVAASNVTAADMPTGGSVILRGSITYFTD